MQDYPMMDCSYSNTSSVTPNPDPNPDPIHPNTIANQKKTRKKRDIKNPIVVIDDVFIPAGPGYINWVHIARNKLEERELILLHSRQDICDQIIVSTIQSFVDENMITFSSHRNHPLMRINPLNIYMRTIRRRLIGHQSPIITQSVHSISAVLREWKGYKSDDPDKEIDSFREYFQRSRHWFDTKKIKTMSHDFWIPTMRLIKEFTGAVASEISAQQTHLRTVFANHLFLLILRRVFEGHIKPSNARKMWLIPAMSYTVFLKEYNDDLRIEVERRNIPGRKNKYIRTQYVRYINEKSDVLNESFYDAMDQYLRSTWNRSVFLNHNNVFYDPAPPPVPVPVAIPSPPFNPVNPFPHPIWNSQPQCNYPSIPHSSMTQIKHNNYGSYYQNVNELPPDVGYIENDSASYFDIDHRMSVKEDEKLMYQTENDFEGMLLAPPPWNGYNAPRDNYPPMQRIPMNVPPLCDCNACRNQQLSQMMYSAPPSHCGCNCHGPPSGNTSHGRPYPPPK